MKSIVHRTEPHPALVHAQGGSVSLPERGPGQRRCQLTTNQISRRSQWPIGQVRIALRRRRLAMPEDPTNQRQPDTAAGANTREGVPEIVNTNVVDPGQFADAMPFLVQAIEVTIASRSRKHP